MQSAQSLQLGVAERLDTEAQSIDSCRPERGEARRRHALRVRLEGHFGVGGYPERAAARLDDGTDFVRLEQRRRPAAKEDRIGVRSGGLARPPDLFENGGDVFRFLRVIEQTAIERAVVADGRTERDVDVEA